MVYEHTPIQGKQFEFIKEKKKIGKTDTDEPIWKVTYTTCPECDSTTYIYDSHHNESVCALCGLVLFESPPLPEHGQILTVYDGLTPSEQRYIKYKLNHKVPANHTMKSWYFNDKRRRIDAILSNITLNKHHRKEITFFLTHTNIKRLSVRLSFSKVVICTYRYYMINVVHVPPITIQYEKYGITRREYEQVERGINRLEDQNWS